jgi:hypothetical protein
MVSGLNMLRWNAFESFLKKYPNATPEELKALAGWINVASGRGPIGSGNGTLLSNVLFAPRFTTSRVLAPVYALNPAVMKNPRVLRRVLADQSKAVASLATVLGIAKVAGASISFDISDSDFLKAKFGNTRIDFLAGVQQPIRLVIGSVIGAIKARSQGKTAETYNDFARAFRYKLAPQVQTALTLLMGKDAVGNKAGAIEALVSMGIPIMAENLWQAYQEGDDPWLAVLINSTDIFGFGASTFKKDDDPPSKQQQKEYEEIMSKLNKPKKVVE